ncbi:hypothetical protein ACFFGT_08440 [Mucilaginibacter angelicae]|uniref:Uncharacterized protein n=1 Tax=Mucilaginibacter angelicae TaxID=869718 RepID=A0ABV6L426_9SPHI
MAEEEKIAKDVKVIEEAVVGEEKVATKIEKEVYMQVNEKGETLKTTKTKAGNTKIDEEARGTHHTQLRRDESRHYAQRTTFDNKGRKKSV